jgi:glycosyltransferase involved in cell wall biosynthesis
MRVPRRRQSAAGALPRCEERSVRRCVPAMLNVGLVGPLPPPAGGMAMQCLQLQELLSSEGLKVRLVQTNAPYRPRVVGRLRIVRSLFRLVPYLRDLWATAAEVDVIHLLANSGWAWHLYAAPAVWIARFRNVPIIVNYRGGDAAGFLGTAPFWVKCTLRCADSRIVPSGFLNQVFAREGIDTQIIPNVVDLDRFRPYARNDTTRTHVVVTRNLEPIYDIETAMRAFALLCTRVPNAALTIAGEGPERARLEALAGQLGFEGRVFFAGRLDRDRVMELYRGADLMLNPSTVDNMPNSILEAYAAGVPVVSTNVGGIPYIARDGESALLVSARDPQAMAEAAYRVVADRGLATRLVEQGLRESRRYAWSEIRGQWMGLYEALASQRAFAVEDSR